MKLIKKEKFVGLLNFTVLIKILAETYLFARYTLFKTSKFILNFED